VRSPHFIVILAAFWAALRPTSVIRFLVMLGAEVAAVALDMPNVGSHTLLVLISGACVLVYVGGTVARTRRLPTAGALFERIAPFLALQLLLVYVAAAVAKMNTSFFDPTLSCAASISSRLPWAHLSLFRGSWSVMASIWITVVVEVALPVLLSVRRLRPVGLVLGLAFHAVLALAGNVPFSALALALYVVLLPTDTPSRVRALVADRPGLQRGRRLHGDERQHLEEVGDDHVAVGACALVEPGARPDGQLLGHVDLNARHVIAVPDRFEQSVGEAEGKDVLSRLLPEEVVDAIDLIFAERLVQRRVQRSG